MNDSISSFFAYAAAWLRLFRDQVQLVFLEAKLAKSSLFPFIFCCLILLLLGISAWLSLLTLVGYLFYYFTAHLLLSLCAVFLINFIFMLLTGLFLYRYYKDISFQKSRKNWESIEQLKLSFEDDKAHEQKSTAKKN